MHAAMRAAAVSSEIAEQANATMLSRLDHGAGGAEAAAAIVAQAVCGLGRDPYAHRAASLASSRSFSRLRPQNGQ